MSYTIENLTVSYKDIRSEIFSFATDRNKNILLLINKEMYKIEFLVISNI